MASDGNALQLCAGRLAEALRRRDPGPHTEKKIARRLEGIGVCVDGRTVRNWISQHMPQWPAGKHLVALIDAYGLSLMAEVFTEDPLAKVVTAKHQALELEAEIDATIRRLERLKGDLE